MGILGKTAEDVRAPPWPKWRTVGASAPGRRPKAQATDTPHKSSHGGQKYTASPKQNTKWKNRKSQHILEEIAHSFMSPLHVDEALPCCGLAAVGVYNACPHNRVVSSRSRPNFY